MAGSHPGGALLLAVLEQVLHSCKHLWDGERSFLACDSAIEGVKFADVVSFAGVEADQAQSLALFSDLEQDVTDAGVWRLGQVVVERLQLRLDGGDAELDSLRVCFVTQSVAEVAHWVWWVVDDPGGVCNLAGVLGEGVGQPAEEVFYVLDCVDGPLDVEVDPEWLVAGEQEALASLVLGAVGLVEVIGAVVFNGVGRRVVVMEALGVVLVAARVCRVLPAVAKGDVCGGRSRQVGGGRGGRSSGGDWVRVGISCGRREGDWEKDAAELVHWLWQDELEFLGGGGVAQGDIFSGAHHADQVEQAAVCLFEREFGHWLARRHPEVELDAPYDTSMAVWDVVVAWRGCRGEHSRRLVGVYLGEHAHGGVVQERA